jgi:hypothetical protein
MDSKHDSSPVSQQTSLQRREEGFRLFYVLSAAVCLVFIAWDGWGSHRLETCLVGIAIAPAGAMIVGRSWDRVFRPNRIPIPSNESAMYWWVRPWVVPLQLLTPILWLAALVVGRHHAAADPLRWIALVSMVWAIATHDYVRDRKPIPREAKSVPTAAIVEDVQAAQVRPLG